MQTRWTSFQAGDLLYFQSLDVAAIRVSLRGVVQLCCPSARVDFRQRCPCPRLLLLVTRRDLGQIHVGRRSPRLSLCEFCSPHQPADVPWGRRDQRVQGLGCVYEDGKSGAVALLSFLLSFRNKGVSSVTKPPLADVNKRGATVAVVAGAQLKCGHR